MIANIETPKVGVVFYHSGIQKMYKQKWIDGCVASMLIQTYSDIHTYEINYGDDNYSVLKDVEVINPNKFIQEKKANHAEAMNTIIDLAFQDGCDYVFNTNLDDWYREDRVERQLTYLQQGYDIVSSDFCYISDISGEDEIVFYKHIKSFGDIKENINRDHNVISHPSVAYSKNFWREYRYDPQEVPKEDLLLWKRAINSGCKMYIEDEVLLYYRIHTNQITNNIE